MELRARIATVPERRTADRKSAEVPTPPQPLLDRDLLRSLDATLRRVSQALEVVSGGPSADAAALWHAYVTRPGKRVRPYLCVVGHDLATRSSQRPEGLLEFASALELLHAFLLIHDDVADRASMRRGDPALHVLLRPPMSRALTEGDRQRIGNDLAVVAGDLVYTAAMQVMLSARGLSPERVVAAASEVLAVCRSTAEGQFNDIAYSARPLASVTPADVLDVYRLKTARYTFEGPLVAGAKLAGGSNELIESLRAYGTSTGIAFQLEDDLLSLLASEEEIGKPPLADLREAKKTWPLLVAYRAANADEQTWLDDLFFRGDANHHDLVRVRSLVRRTGALQQTIDRIEECCDEAERALDSMPAAPAITELLTFVSWLRVRAERWR